MIRSRFSQKMSLKSGSLQYQKSKKPWKKVFCVVDGFSLIVKKSEDSDKEIENIDLTLASSIDFDDDCKKPNSFIIESDTIYTFSADSEEDRIEWVEILQTAMKGTESESISISDFDILKVLGKGTYGKVQLVRYKKTGQIYAMKSLSKANIAANDLIDKTFIERNILLAVQNRFVVSAHFAFQTESKLVLVTDYIPGGELHSRIRAEHHFKVPRVRMYSAQLIEAVGYLHECGVLHRDIKPENVLIDIDGSLKLTDFGVVKIGIDEKDSSTTTFCGTPEYMSPEMIIGEPYSRSVDWWSVGVIIYEMAFGMTPFFNDNVNLTYKAIIQENPVYPEGEDLEMYEDVDDTLIDLISRLLTKDPNNRLGTSEEDYLEIEAHPFFDGFDFEALRNGELENEWKPQIQDATDVSQFAVDFTNETPRFTFENPEMVNPSLQDQFAGFTWRNDF
ncbi:RAC family serine/threonine-protein kinase like protein [Tritrichomonas foetus]|uniref:non-specific serine/threonine protein kinase n=1 Tax=Tritrichomonas foetus TaxID=1144522 RepID=A0A1J4JQ78_9EUKA|nr:RAC family serine/threonine-protein kinase like protein [Tritrichomonas foetus]|eukprot:OHT01273.1 RAC family serine/threonine-protein kinase like protein [Tritrichomonas foetus]